MRTDARRRTLSVAPSGQRDHVSSISREVKRIYAPIRIEAAACLTICSYSSGEGMSMSVSWLWAPLSGCGARHAEMNDGGALPSA